MLLISVLVPLNWQLEALEIEYPRLCLYLYLALVQQASPKNAKPPAVTPGARVLGGMRSPDNSPGQTTYALIASFVTILKALFHQAFKNHDSQYP